MSFNLLKNIDITRHINKNDVVFQSFLRDIHNLIYIVYGAMNKWIK